MRNPAYRPPHQPDSLSRAAWQIQNEGNRTKGEIDVRLPSDRFGNLAPYLQDSGNSTRLFQSAERIENMSGTWITIGIERMPKSGDTFATIPRDAFTTLQPSCKRAHDVLRIS